ncbi:type I-E CRISPR-associated protein Cas6/Cse3/CasE [Streptomyces sp. NPDC059008]|uniref:type I-E CRISPR-associated protein Cas6/Cse3/CasE n=1 Tax=Streptomyces sp. NPDC059008 TaxID=3346693 RepID=UPI00368D3B12
MHLTRFRVNSARPGARRLLSSPQSLHAAVMSSFPTVLPSDSDCPRVLWRVDHNARAEVFLYVVSPTRPDMTHLVEQAGWPAAATDPETPGWQSRPYTPFLDKLTAGTVWAFRLTANPIHFARRKDGEPTKRTAHQTSHHQQRWLIERQERSGFRIIEKPPERRLLPHGTTHQGHAHHGDQYELTVRDRRDLAFTKGSATKEAVRLVTVTYDGVLEVTDPAALRRTLTQGLGKAKAYGCGLMTLAPAATTQGRA